MGRIHDRRVNFLPKQENEMKIAASLSNLRLAHQQIPPLEVLHFTCFAVATVACSFEVVMSFSCNKEAEGSMKAMYCEESRHGV
jgi:hypothetical protein